MTLQPRRGTQDVTFTAVGYGLQESFPDAASWKENNQRVRMLAHPKLLQINTGLQEISPSCFPTTPIPAAPASVTRVVRTSLVIPM